MGQGVACHSENKRRSLRKDKSKDKNKVIMGIRHPLGASDYSSFLLQAQASGAQAVALANADNDFITATKQAAEFGVTDRGQRLVAMVVYITDIHSLGLKTAQGLIFSNAFYWDRTEASRAWSKRFFERFKRMPTQAQAGVYSAVRRYLKAIAAAQTDDTQKVAEKMRELPVDDFFAEGAHVRRDGVLLHNMYLMQVKKPEESKGRGTTTKYSERSLEMKHSDRPQIASAHC
jgi:branched-chain amino acid transport system substrate-binding protein